MQMLHVHGNHWITISNMFCKSNEIDMFDWLHFQGGSEADCSLNIYNGKGYHPPFSYSANARRQQRYAVAFATCLCCGFNPAQVQYTQRIFRTILYNVYSTSL